MNVQPAAGRLSAPRDARDGGTASVYAQGESSALGHGAEPGAADFAMTG